MKRILLVIGVFIVCTVLTLGMSVMLLRSSKVQTAAISLLTEQLSRGLGADVHIEKIDLAFLNSLDLKGVYVGDQQGDTLAFVQSIRVRFNPFAIEEDRLDFPLIELIEPYIALQQTESGTNLDFLIRAFASDTPSEKVELPFLINMDCINLRNARVRYHHIPSNTDLLISDVNADVKLPVLGNDTLVAWLDKLSLKAQLQSIDAHVVGGFHGGLDTLYADHLQVYYKGKRLLLGNVSVVNPLSIDSFYVSANCQDLFANSMLIQDLISDITRKPFELPKELKTLGDIHYRGLLEGNLDVLTLHGAFTTQRGTITTNGHLSISKDFDAFRFDGNVGAKHFELGKVLGMDELGRITAQATIDGTYAKDTPLEANGHFHIQSIQFNGYDYKDLCFQGEFEDNVISGFFSAEDPNLTLRIDGMVDISSKAPDANLTIQLDHLKLDQLGLLPKAEHSDVSFTSCINFSTDGIEEHILDRLHGYVIIDSLMLSHHNDTLLTKQIKLVLEDNDLRSLKLQSDFFNIGLTGEFAWSTLMETIQKFGHELFPNTIAEPQVRTEYNDLDFYAYIFHTDSLLQFFEVQDIMMPKNPMLKGFIHETDNLYNLNVYFPLLAKGNMAVQDITLSFNNLRKQGDLGLSLHAYPIDEDSAKLQIDNLMLMVRVAARNDSLLTQVSFGEDDSYGNSLFVDTHLGQYASRPLISAHIKPAVFNLGDSIWSLDDAQVTYNVADTMLTVSGFNLYTSSQHLRANGVASVHQEDSIWVDLKQLDLSYFLQLVDIQKTIEIDGDVTGWATVYGLFSTPIFEANVEVPDVRLNDVSLGHLKAMATLDRETNHILIAGDAVGEDRVVAHIDGTVKPELKYWELLIDVDSANLSFINFWTDEIITNINGYAFGNVHVFGKSKDTWVTAKAYAKNAQLTIPYTGATYYFTDSVTMDTTSISFKDIELYDKKGNQAMLNGILTHKAFKQFRFKINLSCQDFLAIDMPYDPQSIYYGTAYATGRVDISGDEQLVKVNVNAATREGTDFYLSVATASNAMDNQFIEFVVPAKEEKVSLFPKKKRIDKQSTRLQLSLAIEATPLARVHLALDPHNGDGIVGRGEGNLRLTMDGDAIQLFGTYSMLEGMFSYAIGNIVRRDFSIENGSLVMWNGNPEEPVLDVTAKYRVTASLKDLFGSDANSLATNRNSVPVNCVVNLSESIYDPVLRFGIELPQSDESVTSQVMSIINTDEMLMRQVIYLLAFNRFFTPEYLQNTTVGLNETYSFLSSTVTGQINSWLSRLTNMFTLGFNFRTDGEGANASQEYEAQFQIHPINQLSINGNFGYRYNDLSNRPFFGDVDIEYQLTKDGKLRAKAYTHTVDKYSLKQANTVQGLGLVFRHDFNFGDTKRKRMQRKRLESVGAQSPDSLVLMPTVENDTISHSIDTIAN